MFIQTMRDHSSLLAATAIGKKEVNGGAPLLISLSDSQQPLANQSEEVPLYLVTTRDLRHRGLRQSEETDNSLNSQ